MTAWQIDAMAPVRGLSVVNTPISLANCRPVLDMAPERACMRSEVLEGLRSSPKTLPCKYFYDAEGSRLFDRICELPEYYVTRTEVAILKRHADAIARHMGERPFVLELGSGSSTKTPILLSALRNPVGYAPVDISLDHLCDAAQRLAGQYPSLPVLPICADFTRMSRWPLDQDLQQRWLFFPGSTFGNFDPSGQRRLLANMRDMCGSGPGGVVLGIDRVKPVPVLEAAYNDASGVTAAFNLNVLSHINRELGANFVLDQFRHRAVFDPDYRRIEMQLHSLVDQRVRIGDQDVHFAAGEVVVTEHSHKFTTEAIEELAHESGFEVGELFSDAEERFSVAVLRTRS